MGVYLAMTEFDLRRCSTPPAACAWMACHFSSAGEGLSNLPSQLPKHSLLMIDDSIPPQGHNSLLIARQVADTVSRFSLDGVILDFQRPFTPELDCIAHDILKAVSCPCAVSEEYAKNWSGAILLPPIPLHQQISSYLSPHSGRTIYLELERENLSMVLTKEGCTLSPTEKRPQEPVFTDPKLLCHYSIGLHEESAVFTLERTWDDIFGVLEEGKKYGVIGAVGLYQEFGSICPQDNIEFDRPQYKEAGYG